MSARPYIVMGHDAPDVEALPQPARDTLRMLAETFGPIPTFRSALVPSDAFVVVLEDAGTNETPFHPRGGVWRYPQWDRVPQRVIFRSADADTKEQ